MNVLGLVHMGILARPMVDQPGGTGGRPRPYPFEEKMGRVSNTQRHATLIKIISTMMNPDE
jgi:hypothetical protein